MDVAVMTWAIAITGLVLIALLGSLQFVAVIRPRGDWTIANVYGGTPDGTDPKAYFAFNQGFAWGDVLLLAPLQVAGSIGMLMGENWGFALALPAAALFVYTAIQFFIWDRALGFQERTLNYWVVVWGIWPAFGIVEGVYCIGRLVD